MKNYRHGDVIVRQVRSIPKGAVEKKVKKIVLAEGEVTGHSHQISSGAAKLFIFNDKAYLQVKSKIAALTHEEHSRIELPAGNYEIEIQQDYEPKGWQKVVD